MKKTVIIINITINSIIKILKYTKILTLINYGLASGGSS